MVTHNSKSDLPLVSERLNGLHSVSPSDNSAPTGHLSQSANDFNESYYNNYDPVVGSTTTVAPSSYELDLSVHSASTTSASTVKCEPDTTVSSPNLKDPKVPICPPALRPPHYLDYNFAPTSTSSGGSYNDNNNDLMVQAKLDMYVPPHQYPPHVGASPPSWGSTQYEHSTYHYNTKHIPPPPPLSYHNGYGTQYPHHGPQQSYPSYPQGGGPASSAPKYSQYTPVPSHSFSVNVNVMTPSAAVAAAAVGATPSSSQLVNLFGHSVSTSSQCVFYTKLCFKMASVSI